MRIRFVFFLSAGLLFAAACAPPAHNESQAAKQRADRMHASSAGMDTGIHPSTAPADAMKNHNEMENTIMNEHSGTAVRTSGTSVMESAVLGAGCFWCVEAVFERLTGVVSVEAGYSGGSTVDPTYEQVCTGNTGHAEVARITFDPAVIGFADVLEMFWQAHDPTTPNRQGADVGTQYRSAIFYQSAEQKRIAEASRAAARKQMSDPIVTEITELAAFYPAEDYHQNYYNRNRNAPYCQIAIRPKLKKLRLE